MKTLQDVVNNAGTQVDNLLSSLGIKFTANFTGTYELDSWDNQLTDHWRVTFASTVFKGNKFATDYHMGLGLRKNNKPTAPTVANVLSCLLLDAQAADSSYQDWCDDFGYDSDSISALNTYRACESNGKELRKIFNAETRTTIAAILEDY